MILLQCFCLHLTSRKTSNQQSEFLCSVQGKLCYISFCLSCVVIILKSGYDPAGQTVLKHFYMFCTVSTWHCQACKALPESGLDLTPKSSSAQVSPAAHAPPLCTALIEGLCTRDFPSRFRGYRKPHLQLSHNSRARLWVLFSCISCRLISSPFHLLFDVFFYYMLAINS